MAGKAGKKQASSNTKIIQDLYKQVFLFLGMAMVRLLISYKATTIGQWIKFMILNVPMFVAIYIIVISGKPKYDAKRVVKQGIDLSDDTNLISYFFDLIYLSLFGNIGVITFRTFKFWWCLLLCPIYAGYKLYGLKNMIMPGVQQQAQSKDQSKNASEGQSKSKRQMKRDRRGDGDSKIKVKYR
ncbi:YLR065C [Saccharomyces arboricola H-6]|uniref:YLR065C n=1 Tax=Saccharomyces arboricola (strain H-6 / AS 2.3317 / CBS 10644) TaxID=1160507 RepID=J8PKZ5_SACAR|nr:YLR065C [Saccharomyces arboricola H-6]